MQQKLRDRIHFHGKNRDSLMKFIDAKALPKRYGGDAEIPDEPVGESLYNYFCAFEEDFKGNLLILSFNLKSFIQFKQFIKLFCYSIRITWLSTKKITKLITISKISQEVKICN